MLRIKSSWETRRCQTGRVRRRRPEERLEQERHAAPHPGLLTLGCEWILPETLAHDGGQKRAHQSILRPQPPTRDLLRGGRISSINMRKEYGFSGRTD
jgi:hypothetical protein